jgi:tyrosinase
MPMAPPQDVTHHAKVHGINRGAIGGSFLVATFKEDKDGKRSLLGYESILSRWHTSGCANCQNHQQVKTFVPLRGVSDEDLKEGSGVKIVPVVMPRLNSKGNMLVGGAETPTAKLGVIKTAAA